VLIFLKIVSYYHIELILTVKNTILIKICWILKGTKKILTSNFWARILIVAKRGTPAVCPLGSSRIPHTHFFYSSGSLWFRRKKHVIWEFLWKGVTLSMNCETTPWPIPKIFCQKLAHIKDIRFQPSIFRFLKIRFFELIRFFIWNLSLCSWIQICLKAQYYSFTFHLIWITMKYNEASSGPAKLEFVNFSSVFLTFLLVVQKLCVASTWLWGWLNSWLKNLQNQ
jgi:hypothetical protein